MVPRLVRSGKILSEDFHQSHRGSSVYSLNGSRLSNGVVPRDERDCGSTLPFRGVCMPDGVLDPLRFRLVEKSSENTQN